MKSLIITSATLSLFFNWHSQSKASPFSQESKERITTEMTQNTSRIDGDNILYVSDDNCRSVEEWKEYFDHPPFTATAQDYKNAGIMFFHHGNFAYAAQCFQNFCALKTNPPEMAYFATANILNKVDGYDGSIESFDPPFARTVSLPTQLYRKLGEHYFSYNFSDFKKALENYKIYFNQENQPIPEVFFEATATCNRLKNYTKGLFYIQKYIETAQKINPAAYWYFAHFSYELDDYPTSVSYYEKYFEHCENPSIEAYFNYADSLIFLQNNTKTIKLLKKYIKEKSKDTSSFQYDAYRLLSLAYLKNQDFKKAKTAFENYLDILKKSNGTLKEDLYIQAERIYMSLGDYKASSKYYKEHLRHFPSMSTLNMQQALLSFIMSNDAQSTAMMNRLLSQRQGHISQIKTLSHSTSRIRGKNHTKKSKSLVNENTVQELKKSISIQNYDNAKKIFDQVRKVHHPDLVDLENEMQEVFEKCTQHFERVTQISSPPRNGS